MTANQSIKPVTCKFDEFNNLEIGGCKVSELIKEYGSPLMIYDDKTIREMTRNFKKAFKNTNIQMMYAAKAFTSTAIFKIMQKEGFGLDCVSGGEIYTAKASDFDMKNIIFNGNNKSKAELEFATDNGVGLISVDNFYEAKLLNEICQKKNITVKILLRVTPGIECHTHEYIKTGHLDSKFGFDLSQVDEIINLISNEYKNLDLVGLHAHLGSQIFQTDVYYDAVKVLFKEAKRIKETHGIELSEFNIGGGLGIKYTKKDMPVSVFEIADAIKTSLKINSEKYNIKNPKLYIEPGRSIVGTAGVTVYTVGSSKQVPEGRKYIAVDGGMADNIRPALYGAEYTVDAVKYNPDAETEEVTIAGRFCESGDILANNVTIQKLSAGDLICFYNTGAYCYSMSSNYNMVLRPEVVLVKDGKSATIIKRQTNEQLIECNIIPEIVE